MVSKCLFVVCCVLAAVLADEKYTDKYDNIDIEEILHNDRLLEAYYNCIMEKGKCTPEGKELKDNLQDAIETGCEKCTEIQDKKSTRIIEFLITEKRKHWDELTAKFDPTGKWRKTYEERAKAKGLVIPA